MTEEQFTILFGREPVQDDLDRVNCIHASSVGHRDCGLCRECKKPKFECICKSGLTSKK